MMPRMTIDVDANYQLDILDTECQFDMHNAALPAYQLSHALMKASTLLVTANAEGSIGDDWIR